MICRHLKIRRSAIVPACGRIDLRKNVEVGVIGCIRVMRRLQKLSGITNLSLSKEAISNREKARNEAISNGETGLGLCGDI